MNAVYSMPQLARTTAQSADDFRLRHPRAAAALEDASTALKWTIQQIIDLIKAIVAAILRFLQRLAGYKTGAQEDKKEEQQSSKAQVAPLAKTKPQLADAALAPFKESVEHVAAEPVDAPKRSYARASGEHPDIEDAIFEEAAVHFAGLDAQTRDMAHEMLAGMVPKLMDPGFVAEMQEQAAQEGMPLEKVLVDPCNVMTQSAGHDCCNNRYNAICTEVTQLLGTEVLSKFSSDQPTANLVGQSPREKLLTLIMKTLPDVDDVLTDYLPRHKLQALRQYGLENVHAIAELKNWKVMLDAVAHDPSLKVDFSKEKKDERDDDELSGKPERPRN